MGLSDLWKDRPAVHASPIVGGYETDATALEIGLGSDAVFDEISRRIREEYKQGTRGGYVSWYRQYAQDMQEIKARPARRLWYNGHLVPHELEAKFSAVGDWYEEK